MSIRVKKFHASSIGESKIFYIIGKRHTGKSVLIKDLLYHMPRPDYAIAMAPTEDSLATFREFLPPSCIFDRFDQGILDAVVSLQRQLVNSGKKRTVLIILDDCLYQKGVLKTTSMRSIFFNGRHDHISLICASQYSMELDVSLRSNIDYLFTMRENIVVNRQKLYKYYFGQFPKFDEFDRVMSACTSDYRALVMDGTLSSTDPMDTVRWYKARLDVPKFKLCKSVFWKMSSNYGVAAKSQQFEVLQSMSGNRGVSVQMED